MKIGLFVSPARQVPPESTSIAAPWWLMRDLADGLVGKGHTVTLYAAHGSQTGAQLVDCGIDPFEQRRSAMSLPDYHTYAAEQDRKLATEMYARADAGDVDVVGNFTPVSTIALADKSRVPTVFTIHNPVDDAMRNLAKRYGANGNIWYVGLTASHIKDSGINFVDVVPNGIRMDEFVMNRTGSDGMLFVGRIRPEKGVTTAARAALDMKLPLVISGQYFPADPESFQYWAGAVKPFIDDRLITYRELLERGELIKLYGNAKLLLFPIQWEEPFGLVMIEAMACGTPVVAFARGSVPEIVEDGVAGFIVNSSQEDIRGDWVVKKTGIEGIKEAIGRIYHMSPIEYQTMRAACRKHVEDNFSVKKMVDRYEEVYRHIMNNPINTNKPISQ